MLKSFRSSLQSHPLWVTLYIQRPFIIFFHFLPVKNVVGNLIGEKNGLVAKLNPFITRLLTGRNPLLTMVCPPVFTRFVKVSTVFIAACPTCIAVPPTVWAVSTAILPAAETGLLNTAVTGLFSMHMRLPQDAGMLLQRPGNSDEHVSEHALHGLPILYTGCLSVFPPSP